MPENKKTIMCPRKSCGAELTAEDLQDGRCPKCGFNVQAYFDRKDIDAEFERERRESEAEASKKTGEKKSGKKPFIPGLM